jgi:2-octaprenyl-6-methoxyphenol hydroxylase
MSNVAASAPNVDVAIVGGGMVGASLALALARTQVRVAVIEPVLPESTGAQPSFDDRCTALSNGSRRVLETIGAWSGIESGAAAISEIRVSDAGRFGATHLNSAEQGLPALGYTVSNRMIGSALWSALRTAPAVDAAGEARVQLLAPAKVSAVQVASEFVTLDVEQGGAALGLRARLVVAADGAQSLVRSAAGIEAEVVDYRQIAIVANLSASVPASGIAYERFTPHGPIALLPRRDGSYTIVWTVATREAPEVLALDDDGFRDHLQQAFGWRAGRFTKAGKRASYPLALTRAERCVAPRTVLVGNAAQSLHPVAGQGFNLGLRDAAVLAELVAEAKQGGSAAGDIGAAPVLDEYVRRRGSDRDGMIGFTDGLVRLFALEQPGAPLARSLVMLAFDGLPPLKQALARVSWGFGTRAPHLLRGLPLT